ncbi:hypothetical protein AYL99_05179 [Fonsecaea erecta]|uniref:Uncharacterized protein n=1 Tax=Fonsecaea erecta TaxID=1367422 RepID=A0A178ZK58_9EURO|nr:hypothetical protein AYL99_05179 [Fonsecaea erecta]OAP60177.1 hypothetical protein AYL99_05179 [Fonsecaea erecta]
MEPRVTTLTERILSETISFINWAVGAIAECSVLPMIEGDTRHLLKGNEFAPVDYGLVETPPALEGCPAADRAFELWRRYPDLRNEVRGVEFKCFGDSVTRVAQERPRHTIALTPSQQQHAAAVLVYSCTTPRLIRVIPAWFFDYAFTYSRVCTVAEPIGAAYHCRIATRAPVVWDAFAMPIACLGKDLNDILAFCQGKSAHWSNSFRGWSYEHCPRPRPCGIEEQLIGSGVGIDPDAWWIDDICTHFATYGRYHDARKLDLRPGVGDFAFVRRATGEMYSAELKRAVTSLGAEGEICCVSRFRDDIEATVRGRYFSALNPVDIYLLELRRPQWGWLLLPQNILPDSWFDGSAESQAGRGRLLRWKPDSADFFARHRIHANPSDGEVFVAQADRILNRYSNLHARPRPYCLPLGVLNLEAGEGSLDDGASRGSGSAAGSEGPRAAAPRAGWTPKTRPSWSQLTFDSTEAGRYNRQCEKLGWGSFYPLQAHPAESYVFTPFLNQEFALGHPDTPFIKVRFACISLVDSLAAISLHGRRAFERATRQGERSIVVLAPSLATGGRQAGTLREQASIRYVIPSEQLASPDLAARFEAAARRGATITNPVPLPLRDGELIDVYAVPLEMVVFKLFDLFQQLGGAGTQFFGIDQSFGTERLRCGCTINVQEYITNQSSLLRAWVEAAQTMARTGGTQARPRGMTQRRSARTCEHCRSLKLGCSLDASGEQERCDRCKGEDRLCVVEKHLEK